MRLLGMTIGCALLVLGATVQRVTAQTADATTREAEIAAAQAEKAKTLRPYTATKGEVVIRKGEQFLNNAFLNWHPFFSSAYQGGGFSPGVGYLFRTGAYSTLDVRGSYSLRQYKRFEVEYLAPRLFERRAELAITAGWREATRVAFFGLGPDSRKGDRTNFGFSQPFAAALFTVKPTRKLLTLEGGAEWQRWDTRSGTGNAPSVEDVYTPQALPGLGADVKYVHAQGGIALDSRPAKGYARRGSYLGVTAHEYIDQNGDFGFRQMDYDAVQHLPILREAWVLSLHAHLAQTDARDGQEVPYFMRPWLGGGSTVRGIGSFRYRDRNSLLLQAEWRIMANRFMETAAFYDAGSVAAKVSGLGTKDMVYSYGFGFRVHGPANTAFRIDLAKSTEGFAVVFAPSAVF